MRAAVERQPPLSAASTRTASLPELRNTPRHRSATRYVRPSATPTRLLPDPMPSVPSRRTVCRRPRREDRQHGEGEQGLERAGRRQLPVRVVRGEDLTAAGVGHQPRLRGDLRNLGSPGPRPDLCAGAVQQGGMRRRRPRPTGCAGRSGCAGRTGLRAGTGRRSGRREREQARRADRAGRRNNPGSQSDCHTANVGTVRSRTALPWPRRGCEHPDATCVAGDSGADRRSARLPAGVVRQPAWCQPTGSVGTMRRRKVALSGVSRIRSSRVSVLGWPSRVCRARRRPRTAVNSAAGAGVPRGGCRRG